MKKRLFAVREPRQPKNGCWHWAFEGPINEWGPPRPPRPIPTITNECRRRRRNCHSGPNRP